MASNSASGGELAELNQQALDADLLVADPGNLGGWALADALNLQKALVQVPGFTPPLDADLYGHGGNSPAFVLTFGSVLPTDTVHVVGPLTAKPPSPLPAHLEAFMQSAGQFGVVYASLGYTAVPEKHELQAVADALAAVAPVSVVWKLTTADQQLLGVGNATLGSNIHLIEWAPQNDVLGHPATRAFLTQAGTNSFNEAAYHGVPVVGLPLFAEQPDNMARAVEQGFGLSVDVNDAMGLSHNLRRAVQQVGEAKSKDPKTPFINWVSSTMDLLSIELTARASFTMSALQKMQFESQARPK
ncbi:hypothetical protein ABBQ38_009588 [Trebouxia sp. C0009 RCD-2024]